MNGAKPDSLAYAQSRNEALAIQEQMEEYNPGLHVIVKPLPPSRRTPFLDPIPDGEKAAKAGVSLGILNQFYSEATKLRRHVELDGMITNEMVGDLYSLATRSYAMNRAVAERELRDLVTEVNNLKRFTIARGQGKAAVIRHIDNIRRELRLVIRDAEQMSN